MNTYTYELKQESDGNYRAAVYQNGQEFYVSSDSYSQDKADDIAQTIVKYWIIREQRLAKIQEINNDNS